jgi:Gpi18-like mannosyltransferase
MSFLRKYGLRLILILICNRLILAGIGAIAIDSFAPQFHKPPEHVFAKSLLLIPWGAWDTGAYMTIVKDGYVSPDGSSVQIGWFPLYPLAVKLVSLIIPNAFMAGLVVSNLCLLGMLFLFGAWLATWIDQKTAYQSALFVIFFPTSMVLSGAFSESIFLLLLVAALFLIHQKKNIWACVAFSLLLISRPVAISTRRHFHYPVFPVSALSAFRTRLESLVALASSRPAAADPPALVPLVLMALDR